TARDPAGLLPALLDAAQRRLRGLDVAHGQERPRLGEQRLLDGEIAAVLLVAAGVRLRARVEEDVLGGAEPRPPGVVVAAAGPGSGLPLVHESAVLHGGFAPVRRVGKLLRPGDQLLLDPLPLRGARVELREMRLAPAIEGAARGGEALPQALVLAAGQARVAALDALPRLEQLAHAGGGLLPLGPRGILRGDRLRLRDDLRALRAPL